MTNLASFALMGIILAVVFLTVKGFNKTKSFGDNFADTQGLDIAVNTNQSTPVITPEIGLQGLIGQVSQEPATSSEAEVQIMKGDILSENGIKAIFNKFESGVQKVVDNSGGEIVEFRHPDSVPVKDDISLTADTSSGIPSRNAQDNKTTSTSRRESELISLQQKTANNIETPAKGGEVISKRVEELKARLANLERGV